MEDPAHLRRLHAAGGGLAELLAVAASSSPGSAPSQSRRWSGGLAQSAGVLVGASRKDSRGFDAPTASRSVPRSSPRRMQHGPRRLGRHRRAASAAGVPIGGVPTEGPGWRWVMIVNLIARALLLMRTPSGWSRASACVARLGELRRRRSRARHGACFSATRCPCPDRRRQRTNHRRAGRGRGGPRGIRRQRASPAHAARAIVDLPDQRSRLLQRDATRRVRRTPWRCSTHAVHAERPRLLGAPDRPRLPAAARSQSSAPGSRRSSSDGSAPGR